MNSLALTIDALFLSQRDALIRTIFGIVGCPQTAEDLAQETYLKMQQAISSQTIDHPRPFLYQIARNLALDHLRKEQIRSRAKQWSGKDGGGDESSLVDSLPADTPGPEQQVADQQQVDLLLAAMAQLSERRRQILVLHKFHHWTYERIGKHLGISRSAVEKNVQAALAHLLASQRF